MAINLQKGQRIDLRKSSGDTLTDFCVGVNWGGIESKGFLGLTKKVQDVDLDLSALLLDDQGAPFDHIYSPLYNPKILEQFGLPPGKLTAANDALRHTGDDRAGDSGGDDGLDNEVITVDLRRIPSNIGQIFFFLNNCGEEDFSMIPYAKIRMFEGTPTRVKEVFASYNVAAEPRFKGKQALILGRLYRKGAEWKFNAIGDPTEDSFVGQTVIRIAREYNNM
ncbi:MAG: TerD family protein [Verrucomicrobiae bacterium]|nr:TerD family protein [Verrucomicrobiae bacterium]